MNYGNIKYNCIEDGEGVRIAVFVSGCRNHCKGCFQPQTWDFEFGNPFTDDVQSKVFKELKKRQYSGISVLGGEPFEEENQPYVYEFMDKVHSMFPNKTIWCYTGYVYDKDLIDGGRKHTEYTDKILGLVDILIDGPFIEEKKNLMLAFRGSSNQRILQRQKDGTFQEISNRYDSYTEFNKKA